jgi:spore coat protein CotH
MKTILNAISIGMLTFIFALLFSTCKDPNNDPDNDVQLLPSGLPTIMIYTNNSVPILDRENWVTMTFSLTDPNNPKNNISEISNQQIRGRGNSTWNAPKKPYRIRFRDDQRQTPFGLPAARNWVLLANYFDRSLIGNAFAFELGKRLGLKYTCSYEYVELFLNDSYQGLYIFTEHVQADPAEKGAPGRPKVDLNEGWFVEIDFRYDEEPRFRTAKYDLPVMIKSPEFTPVNMNNSLYSFVRNDWDKLTNLMFSGNFPENGYRDLVEMDTIIKYFMVQVITSNFDFNIHTSNSRTEPGSILFYKDKGAKISAGPLWDFDRTFGYNSVLAANSYPYPNYPFFRRFFEDPVFLAKWKEIWGSYYDDILSMRYFIDNTASKIRNAAINDLRTWHYTEDFDSRVNAMKKYFNTRIAYLNDIYKSLP